MITQLIILLNFTVTLHILIYLTKYSSYTYTTLARFDVLTRHCQQPTLSDTGHYNTLITLII